MRNAMIVALVALMGCGNPWDGKQFEVVYESRCVSEHTGTGNALVWQQGDENRTTITFILNATLCEVALAVPPGQDSYVLASDDLWRGRARASDGCYAGLTGSEYQRVAFSGAGSGLSLTNGPRPRLQGEMTIRVVSGSDQRTCSLRLR